MSHDEGKVCICSKNHQPHPLELERHHIWPLGMGGPDVESNTVWVCPTTHTNAHELLKILLKRGPLTFFLVGNIYETPVSEYAYKIALDGYHRFKSATI